METLKFIRYTPYYVSLLTVITSAAIAAVVVPTLILFSKIRQRRAEKAAQREEVNA